MKNNHKLNKNLGKRGWQDKVQERIKTLEYFIQSKIKTINGLIVRKGDRGLIGILLEYIRAIRPRSTKSVVRQVAAFVFFCKRIAAHSGLKGLVIYLKASQVLLQQSVGGFRVVDLTELKVRPARNRAGVPLIIPAGVRVKISRDRDIPSIKLWMTLLGLYRVLEFKGKLSFNTITDQGVPLGKFLPEWEAFIKDVFIPNLRKEIRTNPRLRPLSLFPILKSGPTTETGLANTSAFSLVKAARVLVKFPRMLSAYESISVGLGFPALVARIKIAAMADHKKLDYLLPMTLGGDPQPKQPSALDWRPWGIFLKDPFTDKFINGDYFLGKLGFKVEPAGKVRVFAMVDAWTQWLLEPLHKYIFAIIAQIAQDGTFDQLKPIRRLQDKYALNPRKRTFASIDLSAATDRLPISLQQVILKHLLEGVVPDPVSFANNWRELLVGRPYQVKFNSEIQKQAICPKTHPTGLFYSVGQPMGALSSWAMLALTHHAMMQWSCYKVYGNIGWFRDYGVLGDDGVILNGKVVNEYRRLLSKIGVSAGLAKSILAKGKFVIEFAKKFFVDQFQANMLPLKECIATKASTSLILEFARKYELSLNQILSFLGYGFKVKSKAVHALYFSLSTRLRVLLIWLSHPSSPLGKGSYWSWLIQKSWREEHQASIDYKNWVEVQVTWLVLDKIQKLLDIYSSYEKSITSTLNYLDSNVPVKVTTLTSSGSSDLGISQSSVPWRAIINPEVGTSPNMEYDFLTGGMSVHSYRFQQLQKIQLGTPFNEVSSFMEILTIIVDSSMESTEKVEMLLTWYFEPTDLESLIPKEFWPDTREVLKPYREFSHIYKLWENLTKPLWAEYYTGKFPIKSTPMQPDRGEPEGSAIPILIEEEKRFTSDTVNFSFLRSWIWLLKGINLLIELGLFTLLIVLISLVSEPDPESLFGIPEEILDIPESQSPSFGLWLMGLGILMFLCTIGLNYYLTGFYIPSGSSQPLGSSSPVISYESMIQGHHLGVQGPLTLEEYGVLTRTLETQALIDNLAISPIGDLWSSSW